MTTLTAANKHSIAFPEKLRFPGDRFVLVRNVPVFVEHTAKLSDGRVIHFGPKELEAIVERCNRRIEETGDYATITLGHTPRPGENKPQPEVVGFAGPFRLGEYRGRPAILADFHIWRDQVEKLRKYPRRSPELWLEERVEEMFLDPIALLGAETPRMDMGLLLYAAERAGKRVERYTATAPGPTNVALLVAGQKEDYQMALAPEDIQQIIEALEQLDWVQWTKRRMAAEAEQNEPPGGQPSTETFAEGKLPSEDVDPEKAKQILRDGQVHGKPLTEDQRRMFAAAADKAKEQSSRQAAGEDPEHFQLRERYQQLEQELRSVRPELERVRRELEAERNLRRNAERFAKLCELREQYSFDLEKEMKRCAAEKMSDEQFAEHVELIRENYQKIPVATSLPWLYAPSQQGANAERFEKEIHDKARKICEAKAIRGEQVDYAEVVQQLKSGTQQ